MAWITLTVAAIGTVAAWRWLRRSGGSTGHGAALLAWAPGIGLGGLSLLTFFGLFVGWRWFGSWLFAAAGVALGALALRPPRVGSGGDFEWPRASTTAIGPRDGALGPGRHRHSGRSRLRLHRIRGRPSTRVGRRGQHMGVEVLHRLRRARRPAESAAVVA